MFDWLMFDYVIDWLMSDYVIDWYHSSVIHSIQIKLGSRIEARDGVNRTALREIKILQELSHPHVISLKDVFGHRSNVSLVFDFMETDLEVIIRESRLILSSANIKAYMIMTLKGLNYLHNSWILHRVNICLSQWNHQFVSTFILFGSFFFSDHSFGSFFSDHRIWNLTTYLWTRAGLWN